MKNNIHVNNLKLKGLIVEKGYNLTSFSKETGLSPVALSRILNRHWNPRYETICRCIQTLNMTDEQIIDIFFNKD